MALDIVGAGFGRTGTLSLKYALEQLGFERCYHMIEVGDRAEHLTAWTAATRGEPVDWDALFEGYRAAVDWPACNFWRQLADYYPDSKVILTTRDPERWYESVRNTIYPASTRGRDSEDEGERKRVQWINEVIWDTVFGGRFEDRDHAVAVYNAHIAEVQRTVPPERLLVFEASQGWQPLCAFLDRPVPDQPFPQVNSTEEFRSRMRAGPHPPAPSPS